MDLIVLSYIAFALVTGLIIRRWVGRTAYRLGWLGHYHRPFWQRIACACGCHYWIQTGAESMACRRKDCR